MVSLTVIASLALLHGFARAADNMGPAAIMWPSDRVWSADADNTAPCGSTLGVGNRTDFPLVNGRLALVTQDNTTDIHVEVSYSNNPTSNSDFQTILSPSLVGNLGLGHTCVVVPNPPSDVVDGSNGTFRIWYESEADSDGNKEEDYYACADVTFVTSGEFDEAIPCFNATTEDPSISTDSSVNVTLTSAGSDSSESLTASQLASHVADAENIDTDKGLSGGDIAGIVVGSVAGLVIIGVAIFYWIRYSHAKKESARAKEAAVSKFDIELASTPSAPK